MAKFRRNHESNSKGKVASHSIRLLIAVGIFIILILGGIEYIREMNQGSDQTDTDYENINVDVKPSNVNMADMYPQAKKGNIVEHKYHSLSYVEKYEQAEWVIFEMDENREKSAHVKRWKNFSVDPFVSTGSAKHSDYIRSGYDRGHLVPAHALGFNKQGMKETFYMSNISPQNHDFNSGIWRELEEQCGYWAKKYKHLIVITGPIFGDNQKLYIGKNKVAVPKAFYKIIYADKVKNPQMIGYIMPNKDSDASVNDYAVSVDQIENVTNIDFFGKYIGDTYFESLESTFEIDFWDLNKSVSKRRNKYK